MLFFPPIKKDKEGAREKPQYDGIPNKINIVYIYTTHTYTDPVFRNLFVLTICFKKYITTIILILKGTFCIYPLNFRIIFLHKIIDFYLIYHQESTAKWIIRYYLLYYEYNIILI